MVLVDTLSIAEDSGGSSSPAGASVVPSDVAGGPGPGFCIHATMAAADVEFGGQVHLCNCMTKEYYAVLLKQHLQKESYGTSPCRF